MSMQNLPHELLFDIADHLDRSSIVSLTRTSKRLRPTFLQYLAHHSVVVRLPQEHIRSPPCLYAISVLSQIGIDLSPYTSIYDPLPFNQIKSNVYFALVLLESKPEDLLTAQVKGPEHPVKHDHAHGGGEVVNGGTCWAQIRPWEQRTPHKSPQWTSELDNLETKWRSFDFFPNIRSVDVELRITHGSKLSTVGSEGKVSAQDPLSMLLIARSTNAQVGHRYASPLREWGHLGIYFARRWFCGNSHERYRQIRQLAVKMHQLAGSEYHEYETDWYWNNFRKEDVIVSARKAGLVKVIPYTLRTVLEDWGLVREVGFADEMFALTLHQYFGTDVTLGFDGLERDTTNNPQFYWKHWNTVEEENLFVPLVGANTDDVVHFVYRKHHTGKTSDEYRAQYGGMIEGESTVESQPRRKNDSLKVAAEELLSLHRIKTHITMTAGDIRYGDGLEFTFEPRRTVRSIHLEGIEFHNERLSTRGNPSEEEGLVPNLFIALHNLFKRPECLESMVIKNCRLMYDWPGRRPHPRDDPAVLRKWTWEMMFMSVEGKRRVRLCSLEGLEDFHNQNGVPDKTLRRWERHVMTVVSDSGLEEKNGEVEGRSLLSHWWKRAQSLLGTHV
ncbi:hypothetical protein BJ508DRAFT_417492 [Ascobolus immersus RN42]|uniref:F-box domain-containing protein n=1 Tax=Ascobolus immersus RN42 TaxID=1160509 RepID=A0A3N4HW12_ASCIM|nr:hypothetical protein BJ508DRAFT_417492 [Ascobolus immersus RN42]